jgi:hypothetical protein
MRSPSSCCSGADRAREADGAAPAAASPERVCCSGISCDDAHRARQQNVVRMTSESPHLHEVVEIPYSRVRAMVFLFALLGFAGWLAYWTIVLLTSWHATLQRIAVPSAIVVLLIHLLPARRLLRAWLHQGPVVTMDADGVRDVRQSHEFVEWKDIEDVALGYGASSHFLCFTIRDSVRERGGAPGRSALLTLFRRLHGVGDWNVDLRLLAGGRYRIWQKAKQMRQLGIRQHVLRSRETLRRTERVDAAGEHRLEY